MAHLPFARNRVERPFELACHRVVGADVPRRGIVALVDAGREDQEVLEHGAGRGHLDDRRRRIHAQILPEIDEPGLAERRDELAGLRVQRVDAIAHEMENPLSLRALPVHQAAVPQTDDGAVVVPGWIERPDLFAGRRVQRHRLQAGRVTYITPFTTIGFTCIVDRSFASPVLYIPRALEPVDVGRVNLRQRRVLVALLVAAIHGPVHVLWGRRRAPRSPGSRQ